MEVITNYTMIEDFINVKVEFTESINNQWNISLDNGHTEYFLETNEYNNHCALVKQFDKYSTWYVKWYDDMSWEKLLTSTEFAKSVVEDINSDIYRSKLKNK